jgi:hypothetical protein
MFSAKVSKLFIFPLGRYLVFLQFCKTVHLIDFTDEETHSIHSYDLLSLECNAGSGEWGGRKQESADDDAGQSESR